VTELGFTLMAILGAGFTVRLKVAVAEGTPPGPLAVMVIWVLPVAAPLPAFRLMLPEVPAPAGEVMVVVTLPGRLLVVSVMLPV
jgi:hypothetical protein